MAQGITVTCSHCGRTSNFEGEVEVGQAGWVLFKPKYPAHCAECQHSFTRLLKDGCAEHPASEEVRFGEAAVLADSDRPTR